MITISQTSHEAAPDLRGRLSAALDALLERSDLGFYELPDREPLWQQSKACAEKLMAKFDQFVFIGIGGSGLGGRTVSDAFQADSKLFFLENVDAHSVERVFNKITPSRTAFVLTSKSGSTLETLALANAVEARLVKVGLSLRGRSVVITENKKSPLSRWASDFSAELLEIPLDVGGRFSVLTPVGLLPAALLGVSLDNMMAGAKWALLNKQIAAELASQIVQSFSRNEWVTQFWVYSDRLATFGDWLQQLWAESLGKKQTRDGVDAPRASTPMACVGAIDQHSILQQVVEGERDKFVMFFNIKGETTEAVPNLFPELEHLQGNGLQDVLDAEFQATLQALGQAGVSYTQLEFKELSGASLAAGFMLFELVIGAIGELHNINAFDQPGVEHGKILAKGLLLDK